MPWQELEAGTRAQEPRWRLSWPRAVYRDGGSRQRCAEDRVRGGRWLTDNRGRTLQSIRHSITGWAILVRPGTDGALGRHEEVGEAAGSFPSPGSSGSSCTVPVA